MIIYIYFNLIKGRFISGVVSNDGEPFFALLSISAIDLREIGTFKMTFYVYMFCDGESPDECNLAGDSIKIILNYNDEQISQNELNATTIDYTNIGKQRVWNQVSFDFNAVESSKIMVIFFCQFI